MKSNIEHRNCSVVRVPRAIDVSTIVSSRPCPPSNPAAVAEFVGFTHAKSTMSPTESVSITVNSSLELLLAVPPGDVMHSRTRGNGEGNV